MTTLNIPATTGTTQHSHTEESDAVLYSDMYQWFSASSAYQNPIDIGQTLSLGRYYGMEGLLKFDTTLIPKEAILDDISLSATMSVDTTTTDCVIEAFPYPGGAPTGFKQWIDFNLIDVATKLAQLSTVGLALGPINFTTISQPLFKNAINRNGNTWLLTASDRSRLLTVPTNDEYITLSTAVGNKPTLNVVYHIPSFPKATIAPMNMPSNPFRGGR